MKKTAFIVLWILFLTSRSSLAADHSGCLTCHQYAGQAIMTEKGKLKVTHISEEKFLKSPHKDLGCQDCHIEISSMPPEEKPKIDCRTTCHQSNKEKKRVKKFPLHKMHEGERSAVTSLDDKSPCRICHNSYPHSKYKLTRALLNKHTVHLVCEVCHLDTGDKEVYYDWIGAENAKFMGEPFGYYFNPVRRTLSTPKAAISRIGIYNMTDGERRPLMKRWNKEEAKKLKLPEKNWNTDQSVKAMNHFHEGINKMVLKKACKACHSNGGLINFRTLGFSEKRAGELENMELKRLVATYETFHMPQMFMKQK